MVFSGVDSQVSLHKIAAKDTFLFLNRHFPPKNFECSFLHYCSLKSSMPFKYNSIYIFEPRSPIFSKQQGITHYSTFASDEVVTIDLGMSGTTTTQKKHTPYRLTAVEKVCLPWLPSWHFLKLRTNLRRHAKAKNHIKIREVWNKNRHAKQNFLP